MWAQKYFIILTAILVFISPLIGYFSFEASNFLDFFLKIVKYSLSLT